MFTITPPAACHLADRLAEGGVADRKAFTFVREGKGWRMHLSDKISGDIVIRHDDIVVMTLDNETATRLNHRCLELKNTRSGPRLRMPTKD